MTTPFEVLGDSTAAPFSLKVRRGEGMVLLSMNWKKDTPPDDFAGFAIECKPPGRDDYFALENRLSFAAADGSVSRGSRSTRVAPLQKFRWVHFPRDAEVSGEFTYRVTPVFMNENDELTYGEPQTAAVELGGDTYPGKLNVAFTRGFVSSQAFVDRYQSQGPISTLLPEDADQALDFTPTHPEAEEAYEWMGFEARRAILDVLDEAIADPGAEVRVVAYDLNEPELISRLERLGGRLKAIVDDSNDHGAEHSAETRAAERLATSAGAGNVKRQAMGGLQHNKTIVVDGPEVKTVVCGSTNFSWRGFFVQANNAAVLHGADSVEVFKAAFEAYWDHDDPPGFGATPAAELADAGLAGIDARVAFSPHAEGNALLAKVAEDIAEHTESSLLYSLAFLYQTPGPILDAIEEVTNDEKIFVYGISDHKVGGLDLQKTSGNVVPVSPAALTDDAPEPFSAEPVGGSGNRMHHKFVVIDFDQPTARVYLGSYNFSGAADLSNGENLLLIKDRRVAASYAVEALRIFDHYRFRVAEKEADDADETLSLARPPREPGEKPWWEKYYSDPQKARDRQLFA
jgi:phosphatidylserine/phosphatidylglycerophosphate/cardiolipin synthase-like enzyme